VDGRETVPAVSMKQTTEQYDEIESMAVAMFRRAWRRARQLRGNFALRYDSQGAQHTIKLIDVVLEQETMK
jgi:glutamate synthase domain-containing protein 2